MDMRISGSGTISSGEYDKIRISGSGRSDGPIRCESLHCSGAFSGASDIECVNDIHVSGSFRNEGTIKAKELSVSGSARNGAGLVAESVKVSGSFKVEGNLKAGELRVSGGVKVEGDIEAESARVSGGIACTGLINAEELWVDISGSDCRVESIGGSRITIEDRHAKGLIEKLFGSRRGRFTVSESIEGDEISIEGTRAKTVTGRQVVIGKDCQIDLVQYTEAVEISPEAKIGKCVKI